MSEIITSHKFLETARQLGSTRWASFTRVCCIPFLFDGMERVFVSDVNPVTGINDLFDKLIAFLGSASTTGIDQVGLVSAQTNTDGMTIEEVTGEHYGRLFHSFSENSFWDEPLALLRSRLARNNIDLSRLHEQQVLDTGCGGGRYTVAWKLLGAKGTVGIDISPIGISNAKQRIEAAGITGVSFEVGSALDLPCSDNSFGIVFSNGVLHHTVNWKRGVAELVRVLKPGGMGWLYLIEKHGGLYWRVIDVLRELMKDEDREFARIALQTLRIPHNRIFYMLDHVMVPINLRLESSEIEQCLASAGAAEIRRLERGADFDRIEQLYRGVPAAQVKYGAGENRYVFTKPET